MQKRLLIIFLFALIIAVPATYAADNQTALELTDEDSLSGTYYFDSNVADDTGDGSADHPYKLLTKERIVDNSVIYLKNGQYNFGGNTKHIKNVTFIGQNSDRTVIQNAKFYVDTTAVLKNLKLKSSLISNSGNTTARYVIFENSYSSSGGAIVSQVSTGLVKVYNCTFTNNSADYGGAIYMKSGTLSVSTSLFNANHAKYFGGAITCEDDVDVTIFQSEFANDYSDTDAGGAIYVRDSYNFILNKVNFLNCSATFGGAVISLNSNITMKNSAAKNNRAKYDGGAVYLMYRYFTLMNSTFEGNAAKNGGALFVDGADIFNVYYNTFKSNTAQNTAGAVYCLASEIFYDSIYDSRLGNTFTNNAAKYMKNAYQTDDVNITIASGNYSLLTREDTYDSDIPGKYDLRTLNQVSSVKNQGSGGNCWAFATLGALESCIMKATGVEYDFSENNMKNIMSLFSDYGWDMETNEGGYDDMGVGCLVGWLGPLNESEDRYNPKSTISPVLDSLYHIQNVLFLTRTDYTDNDDIKKAIMNYGGVATSVYWSSSNIKNSKNYYYNGNAGANHAVVIVGWDDDYSKSNFKSTPAGDGAWIIKNSWGNSSGENGFYYVSYYDTKLAQINKYDVSYTFILNDSIKYDNSYQYDIPGRTDFFLNSSNVVWYKNKFTADRDEYLIAVSTYFQKETAWDLSIYVNGKRSLTQSGNSPSSYSTIELDKAIQLSAGDEFEVEFKISVDSEAGVPISEAISLNKQLYIENMSFISYDGKKWADLYALSWKYSTHTYMSQVACIKAFTVSGKMIPKLTLSVNDVNNPCIISVDVKNPYGNPVKKGKITFTIEGESYVCDVVDGYCEMVYIFKSSGQKQITAKFTQSGYTSPTVKLNVNVNKNINKMALDIKTDVLDAEIMVILNKKISATAYFIINNHNYQTEVVNGIGVLKMSNCYRGTYNVKAYMDPAVFSCSNVTSSFTIDYLQTYIQAYNMKSVYSSSIQYSITLVDKAKKVIADKTVEFNVNGVTKRVKTNANGVATVTFTNLNSGYNMVDIVCHEGGIYLESNASKKIYIVSTINTISNVYTYNSNYYVYFTDLNGNKLLNKQVMLNIAGVNYTYTTDGSLGRICHNIKLEPFVYTFTIFNTVTGEVAEQEVSVVPRICENTDMEMYFGAGEFYTVKVLDNIGNPAVNAKVTFKINGQTRYAYTNATGHASIKINLNPGVYTVTASFKGFTVSNTVTVNHVLITSDLNVRKGSSAIFTVKLVNSKVKGEVLKNKDVTIKFRGETYTVKTNNNGIATFKIVADDTFNIGTYNIVTSFAKDSVTNKIRIIE